MKCSFAYVSSSYITNPGFVVHFNFIKHSCKQEEEMRNKIEELKIQRQKRIAERTAASGLASTASRKGPAKGTHSTARETNRIGSVKIRAT